MAGLHEIKTRIASVKSTQQITRAMYLISASKSKKAKTQLEGTRPFFNQIAITLSEILHASHGLETPYFGERSQGKDLYLVLAGDKGMAGGYNHNIINLLESQVDKNNSTLLVAGFMGRNVVMRRGYQVDKEFRYPVVNPNMYRARDISDLLIAEYLSGEYKAVHILYTKMVTPLKMEPMLAQLLPLKPEELKKGIKLSSEHQTIQYEPNPSVVFDNLVPHYVKGILYSAFIEAFTSEQNARMMAMDTATKSADDMIDKLSLRYNRARQAKITQEINEIVGGIPK